MAGVDNPRSPEADTPPLLELLDVAKHFGGVQALRGVSLRIARGSVHALVGENGAGKSTLGRIVSGAYVPDGGRVLLDGHQVAFRSPREALEHRVAAIAQEPFVVPQLTVEENVFLGVEPQSVGVLRSRRLHAAYEELAGSVGFDLPGGQSAGSLRTADQQKVEILRALSRDAQLIVMDEPTAALSATETAHLHEIVRALVRSGKTIILISHFLREVLDLADTVTVLRDGSLVRTARAADETVGSLVEAMLGRPLSSTFPPRVMPPADAPVLLAVRDVVAPGVDGVSLDVRAGEILGIAGLVGAGRTELARALYGAARVASGTVTLAGGGRPGQSPRRSIESGLAMIPESRKDHGLVFMRSITENATLSHRPALSRFGVVSRRRERGIAQTSLAECDVRGAAFSSRVGALSGGNQQKVMFARTLMCGPRVLIADEPTRGVDVGAKRAIYDFLAKLAADGLGVILISSELEEILGLAHRTLVMRGGRLVAEFDVDQMEEGRILAAAFADPATAGAAA